jgi:hypothetical protein
VQQQKLVIIKQHKDKADFIQGKASNIILPICLKVKKKNLPTFDTTKPAAMSSSSIPDNLTRTFSPGAALLTLSSSQYMLMTFTFAFSKRASE